MASHQGGHRLLIAIQDDRWAGIFDVDLVDVSDIGLWKVFECVARVQLELEYRGSSCWLVEKWQYLSSFEDLHEDCLHLALGLIKDPKLQFAALFGLDY